MPVEMNMWGKDHWSTLAYLETECVDSQKGLGKPDPRKIQTNLNRHPLLAYVHPVLGHSHDGAKFGIRLRGGVELPGPDYDEWDCLDDAERLGLIENLGSGINRLYRFTEKGMEIANQIRAHKMKGGNFADFEPDYERLRPFERQDLRDHQETAGHPVI